MEARSSTLVALAEPRRALPIALASIALVATDLYATRDVQSVACLVVFIAAFVALVPATWRWAHAARRTTRFVVYALLCTALVAALTWLAPALLGFQSYVAHPPAAPAILALVLIAGFVLGRDIDMSQGLHAAEARNERLTHETEDARMLALRQHLDPHFLFNTLGAIAEWCREDAQVAERAILELSDMLRTLFDGIRTPMWPLSREVEVLLALHHLYALRDDERYRLEVRVADLPNASLPPLVLLPLFENALKHGRAGPPMELAVTSDTEIRVRIWNAGGFAGPREGGTGIETVERRLRLAFEDRARLAFATESRDGVAGTLTTVTLPRSPS